MGSFLTYISQSIIVAGEGISMATRNESFRVLFSIIRDYIRDFPYRDKYLECIDKSFSKIELPSRERNTKFIEIITKEWKRHVNPINSFPETRAYGYWPAETSPDIIKSRFSDKFSTEAYIPADFDTDSGDFWRDVQKFCALTSVDRLAAVLLSYPTIMAARTVMKGGPLAVFTFKEIYIYIYTYYADIQICIRCFNGYHHHLFLFLPCTTAATLLSKVDLEFHQVQLEDPSDGLQSIARALTKKYCNYCQADLTETIRSNPRKTMWYIHIIGDPGE